MMEHQVQYALLQRELRKELVRHALVHGQLAPLVFLLAAGLGLFLIVWPLPSLALMWTGLAFLIGTGMVAGSIASREVHDLSLRLLVGRHFLTRQIQDLQMQAALQRGLDLFVDIALKIRDREQTGGKNVHLRRALASAYGMLALQQQAAMGAATLGSQERSLAAEVLRELEAMARMLDGIHETASAVQMAREAEETLARMDARIAANEFVAIDALGGPGAGGAPLELQQAQRTLQAGFSRLKSDDGLKSLQQLADEYKLLQPVLDRRRETDPLALAQIPQLAEETYRQGLSVLMGALTLAEDTRSPEQTRLEAEVANLEGEIEALKEDETEAARLRMREETLASHREILGIMQQHQLRFEELLHQCGRCEASLHRTRMELAAITAHGSEVSISAVTDTLRKTIDQAKEVQDEMKRQGL